MSFFPDLAATVEIFISNYITPYGMAFGILLLALALGFILLMILRASVGGKLFRRQKPLVPTKPDPELCDRAAQSLSEAVRIPTVTGDAPGVAQFHEFLRVRYASALARLGVLFLPSGSILLCWRGTGSRGEGKGKLRPALFCGHLDVVPPGPGWTVEPFAGTRRDGRVYGRGALDGKGALIAMLEAVSDLLQEGFAPRRDIYFAFGHDEETGGREGAKAIADLLRRRQLKFELLLDEGGFISSSYLGSRQHSAAMIGVGEKASCLFRLRATAQQKHPGVRSKHTALGVLSEAICRIEAAPPPSRLLPEVKRFFQLSAPVLPPARRFAVGNLPLTRGLLIHQHRNDPELSALFRTDFTPTGVDCPACPGLIPAQADALISGKLLAGDTAEKMLSYIRSLLADLPVQVELLSGEPPVGSSEPSGPVYELLCKSIAERFGSSLPCIPTLLTGSTDLRHYDGLGDNAYRFMPFVLDDRGRNPFHHPDESLSEEALGMGVEFYKNLMKKL